MKDDNADPILNGQACEGRIVSTHRITHCFRFAEGSNFSKRPSNLGANAVLAGPFKRAHFGAQSVQRDSLPTYA